VLIFGGDNFHPLDSIEEFPVSQRADNAQQKVWTELKAKLSSPRDWVFATIVGGSVYVAGNKSAVVDCFDLETSEVAALVINHKSENCTLANFNRSLYAFQSKSVTLYNLDDYTTIKVHEGESYKWWSYTCVYWRSAFYFVMGGNEFLWKFDFAT
jgi:hypothetical protein